MLDWELRLKQVLKQEFWQNLKLRSSLEQQQSGVSSDRLSTGAPITHNKQQSKLGELPRQLHVKQRELQLKQPGLKNRFSLDQQLRAPGIFWQTTLLPKRTRARTRRMCCQAVHVT